jgi:hypothetical protein
MTQRLNTATRTLIAGVVALICFVAVFFFVRGLLTASRERAFDALATRVVRGMSRSEAFTIIKSAGFVAFNPALTKWTRDSNGVTSVVPGSDDWPGPTAPPSQPGEAANHRYVFVEVHLNSPQPSCSHLRSLKIEFDHADRVAKVSDLPTKTVCSPL